MTSYLIDFVLITALVFTSWRVGKMVRELRKLRSEGLATLTALQAAIDDARELTGMLDDSVRVAETRLSVANDGHRDPSVSTPAPTQENWLTLIESRLASASLANR